MEKKKETIVETKAKILDKKNLITNNKNSSLSASTPRVIKIIFIEKNNCSSWDSQ